MLSGATPSAPSKPSTKPQAVGGTASSPTPSLNGPTARQAVVLGLLPVEPVPMEAAEAEHGSFEVFRRIVALLHSSGASAAMLGPHEACKTSEDSVRVRRSCGWAEACITNGAKAMLLVSKDQGPALMVMPASERLSWKKVRTALPGGKNAGWRLATEEEVATLTGGCVPGSVPPFGSVFGGGRVPTYMDKKLEEQKLINFNCGLRTRSISLVTQDFLQAEKPLIVDIVEA